MEVIFQRVTIYKYTQTHSHTHTHLHVNINKYKYKNTYQFYSWALIKKKNLFSLRTFKIKINNEK